MSVSCTEFGQIPGVGTVHLYHIENTSGAFAEVTEYGAILVRLVVPDSQGKLTDVVLGYEDPGQYAVNACFFGSTIGRNGNRIAGAQFSLDQETFTLAQNEFENNLHSGPNGFEKKLWEAEIVSETAVRFSRVSPDLENGFPGRFDISVTYEFTEEAQLKLTYEGCSDKTTVANMTNHSYFNLSGEGSGDILDQELMLYASFFTPVHDTKSIPTGELRPVKGTVMDFTVPKTIGLQIDEADEQLAYTGGYDHNFVCDKYQKGEVTPVAVAVSKKTGIRMSVFSDCPCVQFYAGNFIKEEQGKNGHIYRKRNGFCLETQVEPNAINMPEFHSPVLKAGEKYLSRTIYQFDTVG